MSGVTSGERSAEIDSARALRRHRLRVRTVAVSFAAAVHSARRDAHFRAAERDALVETWRAWSLRQLDGYEREARELIASAGILDEEGRRALEDELARGRTMIRDA